MSRFYDWNATFSRQTGSQGEFCIVAGAKNIGKTFGLRLKCIDEFIKKGFRFVEICRTKAEREAVEDGYFDKLQKDGFYKGYQFKIEKDCGYIAKVSDEPDWQLCMYFVALSAFQVEKRRTFANMRRFIFDEAAIDKKDKYHTYLPNEYMILANILDSITREQPGSKPFYKVYLLMNACDLTCPYLRYLGVDKVPEFGYRWYRNKTVLLHYVEPWNVEDRLATTLVGRMLAGSSEAEMVFNNRFAYDNSGDIAQKTSNAKFAYGLRFQNANYGIWIDYKEGYFFVTDKIPKQAKPVFALTKKDDAINYQAVNRSHEYMQTLIEIYYAGGLRYQSLAIRESFLEVLGYLGIK